MTQLPLVAVMLAAFAQDSPPRVELGKDSTQHFQFDWRGKKSNGKPHKSRISQVVFRFTRPGTNPRVTETVSLQAPSGIRVGTTKTPVAAVIAALAPGDWDLQVALINTGSRQSAWSAVTDATRLTIVGGPPRPEPQTPAAPTRVQVVD